MEILNFDLLKNPLNWVVVLLMLIIVSIPINLILTNNRAS